MKDETEAEKGLRSLQLESSGRMMAGFSHDMKNHLGIIRESNGLIGDVLEFGGVHGEEAVLERLQKAVEAVERRIATAAEMLHHLSGFAHRTDTARSTFDPNVLLVETFAFLQRFARLRKIGFELSAGEGVPPVYTEPALVQHVVYRLVMHCLGRMEAGENMELTTAAVGDGAAILFLVPRTARIDLEGEILDAVIPALEVLDAELSVAEGHRLVFILPSLSAEKE